MFWIFVLYQIKFTLKSDLSFVGQYMLRSPEFSIDTKALQINLIAQAHLAYFPNRTTRPEPRLA